MSTSIRLPVVLSIAAAAAVAAGVLALVLRSDAERGAAHHAPRYAQPPAHSSYMDAVAFRARATYRDESKGPHVHRELWRIARDRVLLRALGRGDLAKARAEAHFQLVRKLNHHAHVTRIVVLRGSREIVNATVNSDGAFVVAPARDVLRVGGRSLGTLLVSIQDIVGFVKIVHKHHRHIHVVVRGSSGQLRTSLPAAAHARLPRSGRVTVAGRRYAVRSFPETGWGHERLRVWLLASR